MSMGEGMWALEKVLGQGRGHVGKKEGMQHRRGCVRKGIGAWKRAHKPFLSVTYGDSS